MRPAEIKRMHWIMYNVYFISEHFLGYSRFKKLFGEGSKKLYARIDDEVRKINKLRKPVMFNFNKRFVDKGFKNSRHYLKEPVVFPKAAIDWPCTQKWSLEFFEDAFGDTEVLILDTIGAIDRDNPQKFERILLRDYIAQLRRGSLKYLKFSNLVQQKMKLQEDMDQEWLKNFKSPVSFGKRFFTFIGGAGSVTPLHNEFPAVVYVQVSGKKKWIIYTANERVFLDPRTERRHYFYSEANPNNVADENFPLIKYGKKYEIILEPGDVLWFPPFAWHHVENLTNSIGVAYKFNDLPAALRSSKVLTCLYFMATKPNLLINFLSVKFSKNNVDTRSSHA